MFDYEEITGMKHKDEDDTTLVVTTENKGKWIEHHQNLCKRTHNVV